MCSDFFVELFSLILPSSLEVSTSFSPLERRNVLLTITRIVDGEYGSLFFQFDVLKALRVIEKVFASLASYPEVRQLCDMNERNDMSEGVSDGVSECIKERNDKNDGVGECMSEGVNEGVSECIKERNDKRDGVSECIKERNGKNERLNILLNEDGNKNQSIHSQLHSLANEDLFFIQSSLTLISQLLESISSQTITLPKVIDIQHEKELKAHKKNAQQLQIESEYLYQQKLLQVIQRLSHDNSLYTAIFDTTLQHSIHNHLQNLYQQVQSLSISPSVSPAVSSLPKEIQSIMKEVKSPHPPIRAMGLSRFDELIRFASDGWFHCFPLYLDELKPLLPRLLTLLQTCLNDEDPDVSVASINAYMMLGTRYYEEVVPVLLKLIGNTAAPFDLRIRGIESVVCIVHYMNSSSFKYCLMRVKTVDLLIRL